MQKCKNCGTDCTPFWRTDQSDRLPLCNACGLYAKKNGAMRPAALWKQDRAMFCAAGTPVGAQAAQPAVPATQTGQPAMPSMVPVASGVPMAPQSFVTTGVVPHGMAVMAPPGYRTGMPVAYMPVQGAMQAHTQGPSAADLLRGSVPALSAGAPAHVRARTAAQHANGRQSGGVSRAASLRRSPVSTLPPLAHAAPAPQADVHVAHEQSKDMQAGPALGRKRASDAFGSQELGLGDDMDMFVEAAQAIGIDDIDDAALREAQDLNGLSLPGSRDGSKHGARMARDAVQADKHAHAADMPAGDQETDVAKLPAQEAVAAANEQCEAPTTEHSCAQNADDVKMAEPPALMAEEPPVAAGTGGQDACEDISVPAVSQVQAGLEANEQRLHFAGEEFGAEPAKSVGSGTQASNARASSAANAVQACTLADAQAKREPRRSLRPRHA